MFTIRRSRSEHTSNEYMGAPFDVGNDFTATQVYYSESKVAISFISLEKCLICIHTIKRTTRRWFNKISPLTLFTKIFTYFFCRLNKLLEEHKYHSKLIIWLKMQRSTYVFSIKCVPSLSAYPFLPHNRDSNKSYQILTSDSK